MIPLFPFPGCAATTRPHGQDAQTHQGNQGTSDGAPGKRWRREIVRHILKSVFAVSTSSGSPKVAAAGGDRVPVAGASPVLPLDTTGRPAEQQRDMGDRSRDACFELSPKTMVLLVLVVASLSGTMLTGETPLVRLDWIAGARSPATCPRFPVLP